MKSMEAKPGEKKKWRKGVVRPWSSGGGIENGRGSEQQKKEGKLGLGGEMMPGKKP